MQLRERADDEGDFGEAEALHTGEGVVVARLDALVATYELKQDYAKTINIAFLVQVSRSTEPMNLQD